MDAYIVRQLDSLPAPIFRQYRSLTNKNGCKLISAIFMFRFTLMKMVADSS
jgi:hypothetical protein